MYPNFSKFIPCLCLAILLHLCSFIHVNGQSQTVELACEHLVTPLGIDEAKPRLSWKHEGTGEGLMQSAYQIMVSSDSMALTRKEDLVWDSGKKDGDNQLVRYQGEPLLPFTKYFWKVALWDGQGKPLTESPVTSFETGMMESDNWQGNWISDGKDQETEAAPYFRKEFTATKPIRSARAYIVAAGLYELSFNGKKTGNHRLDPMYTRFDRRNLYVTYDITEDLKSGKNAVGVLLGNGWYNHQSKAVWNFDKAPWRNRPAFCMDIHITYEDGTKDVIFTDQSWKTGEGPLTFNSIYTGEHFDGRKSIGSWNTTGFNDQQWRNASLRPTPSKNIVSQTMHPIRLVEEIPVATLKKFSNKNYVADLGRNIAGATQVHLKGDSGTVVYLKHGERLLDDGHVDMSNIDVYYRPDDDSDPFQTDIVTLGAEGETIFMPTFNYKGFQYVEITSSLPITLTKEDITAYFMHSDVPAVGHIDSSNPLINKIWWATNNSYLSNLYGYPTDCPQREKNGWTGDGHFAIETGLYNFDAITIYEKWMDDHRDEQQPNGVLPDIIPTSGWGYGTANGTDWTSTIAIIPWTLYTFYGDTKPLEENYQSMKAYVDYVEGISKNGLTSFGRGDWVPVKSTSSLEYTSSIYFFVDATILAKTADIYHQDNDAQKYTALASKIRDAINEKYFHAEEASYASGTQTELSMALQWNIVPEPYASQVAENLAKRVKADNMHLDVGVLGARAILNALSDHGQAETAYALAVQDTYPSWGWWIVNGATTLYENWDIDAERDISLNHMMFGDVGGWFYRGLGGIKPDENEPGFKNVLLEPNFIQDLDHFTATHDGPFGRISSSWKRQGKEIVYDVVVPPNSTATMNLSLTKGQKVSSKGKTINWEKPVVLNAGTYQFTIR